MIHVTALKKRYPKTPHPVLQDLELTVAAGEWVAVVGASGAGKSTLLSILAGLDSSYSGQVSIDGTSLADLNDVQLSRIRLTQVGMVFQSFHLIEDISARDNVRLASHFGAGMGVAASSQRADALLSRVGLAGRGASPPAQLSGGEKQRVAIARALFHDPTVLLCDEPTGNLDLESGQRIVSLLCELKQQGKCVVSVTHEAQLSVAADRVLELRDGRLFAVSPGAPA